VARLAAYAVVYPAALRFLHDFWASLAPQLTPDIDVKLSLDSVSPEQVRRVTGERQEIEFFPAAPGASPASIRSQALTTLARSYDQLVLLDVDDVLLPRRLATAASALRTFDVYGSAMQVIDDSGSAVNGAVFTPTPLQVEAITSGEPVLARMNAFGFSNVAYRGKVLAQCLPVPEDTVLMDWLVASRAYLAGASFMFDTHPRMLYRQYSANTAGVLPPFGPERVVRDAGLVAGHHAKLLAGPYETTRRIAPFKKAFRQSQGFLEWLATDPSGGDRASGYSASLAGSVRRPILWWQHVAAYRSGSVYLPEFP
jgi:hypothetical protein